MTTEAPPAKVRLTEMLGVHARRERTEMELKYVRHSSLGFVLWARQDDLWHSHIGATVRRVGGEIISAGFATLAGGVAHCWGESESLKIKSRKDDSEALAQQLGLDAQRELTRQAAA